MAREFVWPLVTRSDPVIDSNPGRSAFLRGGFAVYQQKLIPHLWIPSQHAVTPAIRWSPDPPTPRPGRRGPRKPEASDLPPKRRTRQAAAARHPLPLRSAAGT